MNYIFYVSDEAKRTGIGHIRKMDASKEIVNYLKEETERVIIINADTYQGEMIYADSIGIVFPVYSWGVSCNVKSFIKNIRIAKGAYVYEVAVCSGVTATALASGDTDFLINNIRIKLKDEMADVFFKCGNDEKYFFEYQQGSNRHRTNIENIMKSISYINLDNMPRIIERKDTVDRYTFSENIENKHNYCAAFSNVFLDDNYLDDIRVYA